MGNKNIKTRSARPLPAGVQILLKMIASTAGKAQNHIQSFEFQHHHPPFIFGTRQVFLPTHEWVWGSLCEAWLMLQNSPSSPWSSSHRPLHNLAKQSTTLWEQHLYLRFPPAGADIFGVRSVIGRLKDERFLDKLLLVHYRLCRVRHQSSTFFPANSKPSCPSACAPWCQTHLGHPASPPAADPRSGSSKRHAGHRRSRPSAVASSLWRPRDEEVQVQGWSLAPWNLRRSPVDHFATTSNTSMQRCCGNTHGMRNVL